MSDNHTRVRPRVDGEMKDLVEEVSPSNGMKKFCEDSVKDDDNEFHDRISNQRLNDQRRCCRYLDKFTSINVSVPDLSFNTKLSEESRDHRLQFDLTPEMQNKITNEKSATGEGRSELLRVHILFKLEKDLEFAQNRDAMWREIQQKCNAIIGTIDTIRVQFHGVLFKLFVLQTERTERKIETESLPFQQFADLYVSNLYDTEAYNDLIDTFGDHAFIATENMIEMHTDYTFQNKEKFLEELE